MVTVRLPWIKMELVDNFVHSKHFDSLNHENDYLILILLYRLNKLYPTQWYP